MDKTLIPSRFSAVTPSDTIGLPGGVIGLYVGGAGNVVAKGADGVSATFVVAAPSFLPGAFTYVMAASTATAIVALRAA